jgi:hypothetical protein
MRSPPFQTPWEESLGRAHPRGPELVPNGMGKPGRKGRDADAFMRRRAESMLLLIEKTGTYWTLFFEFFSRFFPAEPIGGDGELAPKAWLQTQVSFQ